MILVLYNIILITNFKLIEMCIKSSPRREGSEMWGYPYKSANRSRGESFLLCWGVFSLTEPTDLTELFGARFDSTERLRHTELTERYS